MTDESAHIDLSALRENQAHGPRSDLVLHTVDWRAFQAPCSQVRKVVLGQSVEIFREAQDGSQDAVFLIPVGTDAPSIGMVQCKHTFDAAKIIKLGELTVEINLAKEVVKAGQADICAFMTNMSKDALVLAATRAKPRALGLPRHAYEIKIHQGTYLRTAKVEG